MFLYEIHFVVDTWLRLPSSQSFYMKLGEEIAYLNVQPNHDSGNCLQRRFR